MIIEHCLEKGTDWAYPPPFALGRRRQQKRAELGVGFVPVSLRVVLFLSGYQELGGS